MAKAVTTKTQQRIGELLQVEREKANLKQVDVAKRLQRPQSYVSKVEIGERRLDIAAFIQYAEALGLDPRALLMKIMKVV